MPNAGVLAFMAQQEAEQSEQIAREGEHVPPQFRIAAFHCLHCGVLTSQNWSQLKIGSPPALAPTPVWIVNCTNCKATSYWVAGDASPDMTLGGCVHPVIGGGPRPHPSMPDNVRSDYEEAREIIGRSPRGACALLRLATQKLVDDLEPGAGDLNAKIGRLVENGLPAQAQQALDALRVIGNEAVHPATLTLDDDVETATGLFSLINFIIEDRIEQPKRIAEMYAKLPPSKLQGIQQRDGQQT